mmetsp:Transcript_1386/g.2485  ORF Transcript_1386/g.2485 Transcript_1386/m.2485 type:complete len:201 (+) Transcript_1386:718-1320(+)
MKSSITFLSITVKVNVHSLLKFSSFNSSSARSFSNSSLCCSSFAFISKACFSLRLSISFSNLASMSVTFLLMSSLNCASISATRSSMSRSCRACISLTMVLSASLNLVPVPSSTMDTNLCEVNSSTFCFSALANLAACLSIMARSFAHSASIFFTSVSKEANNFDFLSSAVLIPFACVTLLSLRSFSVFVADKYFCISST